MSDSDDRQGHRHQGKGNVFDTAGQAAFKDPVCGMSVTPTNAVSAVYRGRKSDSAGYYPLLMAHV